MSAAAPLHACAGAICRVCSDFARDTGMNAAEHGGGAAVLGERADWNRRFDAWIRRWATPERGTFTNDDIRAALVEHQPPSDKMWGPAMKRAMRDGVMRPVGYTDSANPTRHGGVVRVYEACR